jgi:hypothetical protein
VSGGRKREGGNGPARGRAGPRGREEPGWAARAELTSPISFPFSFLILLKLKSI